jgi:glycosyltransferase involved in cell wall biosynthesis
LIEPEIPAEDRVPAGVNIAGYMRAESGVGEAARLLATAFDAAAVPVSITTYTNTRARQQAPAPRESDIAPYAIDVICVNADQLHHFLEDTGGFGGKRYRIGVWAWEVERLPDDMARSAALVDEIWTYSAHAAHAIRATTDRPVHVVPPPILRPDARPLSRAELGLPEGFVFLFAFDFASVFERKNPLAVIDAFTRAWKGHSDVHLVIKTVGGDAHPEELRRLLAAASADPRVHVRDGYVTSEEHQALVAACDAFVSLHRAEGYGLHLAEAMALGKPVIATGYSGNLEFMDDTNSVLIGYDLVAIGSGHDPYPADARWAQPDIDAAADAMRMIVDDASCARTLGERAAADIARLHPPTVRGPLVADLLGRVPPPFLLQRDAAPVSTDPAPSHDQRDADILTSIDALFAQVRAGAGLGSPRRMVRFNRRIRRFVSRLTSHTAEHQRRIDLSLTYKVNHVLNETADLPELRKLIEELSVRLRELDARLIKERQYRREVEEELHRLDSGWHADPPDVRRDG